MLTITQPFNQAVYQRDNNNRAKIPVVGSGATPNQPITVTLTPTNGGTLVSTVLHADANGRFSGGLVVDGGWYSLSVGEPGGTVLAEVGAGEVFIVWGHSFMQWPLGSASQSNRVMTLADTLPETAYQFEPLTNRVGPFLSDGPGPWGLLGDKLVNRLNVPVLFYCTAYGGSNIDMNYKVLKGIPFDHFFIKYADRQPYRPLEKVLTDYVPKTGVRAVLFEHGYNDVSIPASQFLDELGYVIDYTRSTFQVPDLAFVLVQEETTGQTDRLGNAAIGNALKSFIGVKANTWKGPDFNAGYWGTPGYHDANAHLTQAGNAQFSSDWDSSLTAAFFRDSTPYLSPVVLSEVVTDLTGIDYFLEKAPTPANNGINYLIYGLAALLAIGLLNARFRPKSVLGLLILAMVFIYRERQSTAQPSTTA
jgi:hypothetical protein